MCSAGLLRSATTAVVLAGEPYNFNTRACGTADYALIKLDDVLIHWADEIVCMEKEHKKLINTDKHVVCLNIPDIYAYRDEKLISLIKERYRHESR